MALLEYAAVNFISRQEAGLLELLQKKRIARKKRQRQVRSRFISSSMKSTRKVGCVFPMVLVSIMIHAECGLNDHRRRTQIYMVDLNFESFY